MQKKLASVRKTFSCDDFYNQGKDDSLDKKIEDIETSFGNILAKLRKNEVKGYTSVTKRNDIAIIEKFVLCMERRTKNFLKYAFNIFEEILPIMLRNVCNVENLSKLEQKESDDAFLAKVKVLKRILYNKDISPELLTNNRTENNEIKKRVKVIWKKRFLDYFTIKYNTGNMSLKLYYSDSACYILGDSAVVYYIDKWKKNSDQLDYLIIGMVVPILYIYRFQKNH